ncbi:hypothetical protein B0H17DRAFT_1128170 [Mycena rosella]|uniref:NAD(P)-binding domain-containing protein n=1 Tax=Mycena rosella TaxID=1033263 RepID=A0AAD7DXA5_MYCRO|nr:hypothetical protein B0H17DRAFT_1128170 [Mycena rosella]
MSSSILLLATTGAGGLALSQPTLPKLTPYIRPGTLKGQLTDGDALWEAMDGVDIVVASPDTLAPRSTEPPMKRSGPQYLNAAVHSSVASRAGNEMTCTGYKPGIICVILAAKFEENVKALTGHNDADRN